VVIFDDANLDLAIPMALVSAPSSTRGQACCVAGSRIFAQRGVYERVVEGNRQHGQRHAVGGDPATKGAMVGPLISYKQLTRVAGLPRSGQV